MTKTSFRKTYLISILLHLSNLKWLPRTAAGTLTITLKEMTARIGHRIIATAIITSPATATSSFKGNRHEHAPTISAVSWVLITPGTSVAHLITLISISTTNRSSSWCRRRSWLSCWVSSCRQGSWFGSRRIGCWVGCGWKGRGLLLQDKKRTNQHEIKF